MFVKAEPYLCKIIIEKLVVEYILTIYIIFLFFFSYKPKIILKNKDYLNLKIISSTRGSAKVCVDVEYILKVNFQYFFMSWNVVKWIKKKICICDVEDGWIIETKGPYDFY